MKDSMTDNIDKTVLIDYRLGKIEEAITSLNAIKDIVLRWDTNFAQLGASLFSIPVQIERLTVVEKKVGSIETTMEQLKKFMYKSIGAIAVLSIVIQLLAPMAIDRLKGEKPNTTQTSYSSTSSYGNGTNNPVR